MNLEMLTCIAIIMAYLLAADFSSANNILERLHSFTCHIEEEDLPGTRSNILDPKKLWKWGLVPYKFDQGFSEKDRITFKQAIAQFHTRTCIRWIPRTTEDSFVRVWTDHNPDAPCASAHVCDHGTMTHIAMTPRCYEITHMVHEMLHTLCMIHEQERFDRDEFMDYTGCPADKIPKIDPVQTNYGGLYDYLSQSHYQCAKNTCFGSPKDPDVVHCGSGGNKEGLSVLDADKLNHIYNCGGCHSHRWYNLLNLTDGDSRWKQLVNFAPPGDPPIYVCRSYVGNGEISHGLYYPEAKICQVIRFDEVYNVSRHVQVFTLSNGPDHVVTGTPNSTGYYLVKWKWDNVDLLGSLVAVGRNAYNDKIYMAFSHGNEDGTNTTTYLGKAYHGRISGDFIDPEKLTQFLAYDFYVLACRRGR